MRPARTLRALLEAGSAAAPALLAPGRQPLSYAALRERVDLTAAWLRGHGIDRSDRVAIVLPNGPAMATAFLGVATAACAAPLNPAYREAEFGFYLSDLRARTLLVERDSRSEARSAAESLGIAVLEIEAAGERAGEFSFAGQPAPGRLRADPEAAEPHEVALMLHTSGTTSRPKIVPLSHENLCASAANIRTSLGLSDADRCLNIMPLFHIHGLVAAVLASLDAGGSVYCTPGFDALRFFGWLEQAEPTWYTAVPTMHSAILSRAHRNRAAIEAATLRFVRSSSSPLAPRLMAELESTFGVPAVEAYGMTEAAHQITANDLARRVPGSVGIAAGPEVAILDESGRPAPVCQSGEVGIRGANVMKGYENNPDANAASFTGGWFRTGDVGVMDADGYLTLTGRLKEIINRGGEKISPREVDEVLLDHPAVQEAVTFALPDGKLGEDVAALVIVRPGVTVTDQELRAFVAARLAAFKVPRTVVFTDSIPTGPTGKLQRIGLAARLGLTG